LWDGNVPLHEWSYPLTNRPETIDVSDGRRSYASPEPQTELTTWIFDEGTFVPSAKLVGERRYSIISDYLGTPVEAYDEEGRRVWARELDIYGRVRIEQGEVGMVPFLYQGQYLDTETGLAYNRFRYYSPETGAYISQDPIRLEAGLTNLYAYVHDVNAWIDPWGLIKVSTTVALQDVMNRGLHVNVIEGKKVSMLHSKQLWMERFPRVLNWYLQIPKLGR
jgi:rhs family protein